MVSMFSCCWGFFLGGGVVYNIIIELFNRIRSSKNYNQCINFKELKLKLY